MLLVIGFVVLLIVADVVVVVTDSFSFDLNSTSLDRMFSGFSNSLMFLIGLLLVEKRRRPFWLSWRDVEAKDKVSDKSPVFTWLLPAFWLIFFGGLNLVPPTIRLGSKLRSALLTTLFIKFICSIFDRRCCCCCCCCWKDELVTAGHAKRGVGFLDFLLVDFLLSFSLKLSWCVNFCSGACWAWSRSVPISRSITECVWTSRSRPLRTLPPRQLFKTTSLKSFSYSQKFKIKRCQPCFIAKKSRI